MLFSASARYHTFYQSASWQEALVASEAGVDLAMNELRNRVLNGQAGAFLPSGNWTSTSSAGLAYPDNGHAFPANGQPYALSSHTGEGNTAVSARVYIDVPGSGSTPAAINCFAQTPPATIDLFMCEQSDAQGADPQSHYWYRIRSIGTAGVSGPARANLDIRDNRLRKFSFFTDWRTGQPVSAPQVSRLVEVVAKPLTNFRNALMADVQMNLSNQDVLIDSYDSSKGPWNPTTNVGTMGNIATNGQLINAGGAVVMGNAMTNDGKVNDAQHVTGQQRADFYQELTPVEPLTGWSSVPAQPTITTDASFTASTDRSNPTRVHISGINLPPGNHIVSLTGPPPPASGGATPPAIVPSYIKVLVDGDIATMADSYVDIGAGVNAIFYVAGNINLQGVGIGNQDQLPSRLLINGIQPAPNPDGSEPSRSITLDTTEDFMGIIYAPNHDLSIAETAAAVDTGGGGGKSGHVPNGVAKGWYAHNSGWVGPPESSGQQADHAAGYSGIFGSFVGRTVFIGAKTHVHYDEVLREAGPVNHYEIVNWFEDTVSVGTVNW